MKTSEKVLIGSGVFVLALAGVAAYFSGVPMYRKAKAEYGLALEWHPGTWEHADAGSFQNGRQITVNGMRMQVPQELQPKVMNDGTLAENRYEYRDQDDNIVYMAAVMPPTDMEELPFNEMEPRMVKRLDTYFQSIGQERPQDWSALTRVLYSLDLKDCNQHSYTDSCIFYFLSLLKDSMIPVYPSHAYLFENESGIGTVSIREKNEENSVYMAYVDLFSRDEPNVTAMAVLAAPDTETLYQMVNSVERVPYTAPELEPEPEKRELTDEEQQAINTLLEKIGADAGDS